MMRAKFRVDQKTEYANNGMEIRLSVVTSDNEENKKFFKWTPAGTISVSLVNKETADSFIVGKEYYVDFTECT